MLWVKAFHIIAVVAWFAGLFYLPRLFVYHAEASDSLSIERFKVMESRLYYAITWPSAVLASVLGLWLTTYNPTYYYRAGWMQGKLSLVLLLWGYHLLCGYYLKQFARNQNTKSALFFRIFNEVTVFILIGIVLLVVIKPF